MAYKHSHAIMGLRWLLSTYDQGGLAVAGFRYNNDTAVCDGKLEKRNIIGCAKLGLAGRNATSNGGPYPNWRLTDGRIKCCVVFDVVPEGDAISFLTLALFLHEFWADRRVWGLILLVSFGASICATKIHTFLPPLSRIAMATLKLEIGNHDTGVLSLRALCPFPLLWSVSKGQFSVVRTVEIFPGPVDVGRMSGASKIMVWHLIQRFEFTRSPHSTHEEDWAGVAN
ncbi:hypothetical protein B0H13DRAFT_1901300 [Mycena leptocephala]|nr:hypothetical protein B0H13DRAFT_1901300 [Mycena leptocephala]